MALHLPRTCSGSVPCVASFCRPVLFRTPGTGVPIRRHGLRTDAHKYRETQSLVCKAQAAQFQLPQFPPRFATFVQNNPLLVLAMSFALAWVISNVAKIIQEALTRGKLVYKEYGTDRGLGYNPEDNRDYRLALARTRQAVSTHKALTFMNAGNPSRALVELKRALDENAMCREPLITSAWDKKDLLDLYRLFLVNSEVPHNFPILLQLRDMLNLVGTEAEQLEKQVLGSGEMFSI